MKTVWQMTDTIKWPGLISDIFLTWLVRIIYFEGPPHFVLRWATAGHVSGENKLLEEFSKFTITWQILETFTIIIVTSIVHFWKQTIKEKSLQVLNGFSLCVKAYHGLTLKLTVPFPSASNMRNISSMKTLALSLGMRYMAMMPSLSRAPPGHTSINPLRKQTLNIFTGHLLRSNKQVSSRNSFIFITRRNIYDFLDPQ